MRSALPARLLRAIAGAILCAALCGRAPAAAPTADEMLRAVDAVAPTAMQAGMSLRFGTLWLQAWRQRAPLVASLSDRTCHLGFAPSLPGRDTAWLFPDLPPRLRALWLQGLIQHELAHCREAALEPAGGNAAAAATGIAAVGNLRSEILADLAFALSVDRDADAGEALIRQLASAREARRWVDPIHDSASALRCYLGAAGSSEIHAGCVGRLAATARSMRG